MIVHPIEIELFNSKKVRFYTVKLGQNKHSEFLKFRDKMKQHDTNKTELKELDLIIREIANKGADPSLFRKEDSADALPPRWARFIEINEQPDFGIRLYCIRLSNGIVVLLNGDRKTTQKVNNCQKCYPHFKHATAIADSINKAIVDGNCELDHITNEMLFEEDFLLKI